jgi:DNA-binding HxlR family transcriptional regulator
LVLGHTEVTIELPDHANEDCRAVRSVLARVGDKWSILIIVLLGDGPKRFNEIKRMIGGISQRMLTLTLRGLERDGLVKRSHFPTIPPRVEYELTQFGRSLWDAVEPLSMWAQGHVQHIISARAAFDEKIGNSPVSSAASERPLPRGAESENPTSDRLREKRSSLLR